MEKKINKKALLLSLLFALISCVVIFTYVKGLEKPSIEAPKVKLLVAARNISAGEEIKAEDITALDVSRDFVPAGVMNDRKSIEGFYAGENIIIGEPFRKERVAKLEELALSFDIPDGMRAITVVVNENTIFSYQLRVGDKVDVIANYADELQNNKNVSRIVLQNIEVLSLGGSRLQNNGANAKTANTDESQLPKTVTLCVTPEDAEKMAYITAFADYTLALRGHEDDGGKVHTSGAKNETLAH